MTTHAEPARRPTVDDVRAAARRIAPHIRRTPVLSTVLDGRPLTLKLEQLQVTGSFKLRGALNALLVEPASQVVTASGGNHGLGVAKAAALLGIPATIYLPRSVPPAKERLIAATGAAVIHHGERYAEAAEEALRHADRHGARHLPAYDHADVVAGQGTVGLEISEQAPDCDAVVVAVGGGGLIAGTRLAVGDRMVVGVEPEGCDCLHAAVAAGRPVDSPVDSVAASALGATRIGRLPFEILQDSPARLALVDDKEILAARDRLWEEFRLAVEPAAAAVFAAWLAGRVPAEHPCLVLCAANATWSPALH